ncbi:MAG: arginine--tRNA ligase [Rhodoglobus sp.]
MLTPAQAATLVIREAIAQALGDEFQGIDPIIRSSQFADYQANFALGLAKQLGRTPRDLAQAVLEAVAPNEVLQEVMVSGPGYLNVTINPVWMAEQLRSGWAPILRSSAPSRRVVIDYSSPNVAKEMHVGHLRTTVVGDSLAKILEARGETVIRQNHIGDWGTPFGMLIEHFVESEADSPVGSDANEFYRAARARFDTDADFAERARNRVVAIQAGDAESIQLWTRLVAISTDYFGRVYDTLAISLSDADIAGESSYNDDLEQVCADLEAAGLARLSQGALCAFPDGFTGRDGDSLPLIIRKSDGGYTYATTDLAAIRHRVERLHAEQIIYVVGAPQSQHLRMVWAVARAAGWLPNSVQVDHVAIGNVLGDDGKILRTRSGDSPKLVDLIDEAVRRSAEVMKDAPGDGTESQRTTTANAIAVGALKYADLSVPHSTDYAFSMERMLSTVGNTGPYLQYAVARIRSIRAKAFDRGLSAERTGAIAIASREEHELCLALLELPGEIERAGSSREPHLICAALFLAAQKFSTLYDRLPIISEADQDAQLSRLRICALTEEALVAGLAVLGISAPERM